MRPGHFCPGNRYTGGMGGVAWSGFNEAGAFLPRKPGDFCSHHRLKEGFNEAGAFLPRKRRYASGIRSSSPGLQ